MSTKKITKSSYEDFTFSKPATYQITVLGELNIDWSERLRGMEIKVKKEEGKKSISVLSGRISDQSALSGIFNVLYELHLPVISVRMLEERESKK